MMLPLPCFTVEMALTEVWPALRLQHTPTSKTWPNTVSLSEEAHHTTKKNNLKEPPQGHNGWDFFFFKLLLHEP